MWSTIKHFVIIFIVLGCTVPVTALEQLENRSFAGNPITPDWLIDNQVNQDNPLDYLNRINLDGQCVEGRFAGPNGSNNLWDNADGLVYQTFPATLKASDTVVRIGFSYKENHTSNGGKEWTANLSGTIRYNTAPNSIIDQFLNLQNSGAANFSPGWQTPDSVERLLPGGIQYRMQFYWNLGCQKNTSANIRIDNISCNLSPAGLTASETSAGEVVLEWEPSSSPVVTLASYKIYRKTDINADWGPSIGDSATENFTDDSLPDADVVYYAVTDIDTSGPASESPKSVMAVYRRAKLEIKKVEALPTTVTVGQTVFPVKVLVENTGGSPINLTEVDLYFKSPAIGNYSVTRNTSLPHFLVGQASVTVSFSVKIELDSITESDLINAAATGTTEILTTPLTIFDGDAETPHPWLIRSPANLTVSKITVPPIVYRDQKDVALAIEVINDGNKNAAGYLDALDLRFSLGLYDNERLVDPLPVVIYPGAPVTINYLVDVNPFSATGTCEINADTYFRDINLLVPSTNFDDAVEPGNWIVVAGVLKTYKGPPMYPSFVIESFSFNKGTTNVYAKSENLLPLTEQRFRWYDPDGIPPVRVTDPPLTTDNNGVMTDQFTLPADAKLGLWRIIATRVTNDTPLAEVQFKVVEPAAITIQHFLPPTVTVGQEFTATSTIVNSGGAEVVDAYAALIEKFAGSGNAIIFPGPDPETATVPGLGQTSFIWRLKADTVGDFSIHGSGSGFDANDSTELTATDQNSNSCLIQSKPVLSVVSLTENHTQVYRNQQNLSLSVLLRNDGEAAVNVDTASLSFSFGTHHYSVNSPALTCVLGGNSEVTLVYDISIDENSNAPGWVNITASFTAHEINDPTAVYDGVTPVTLNNAWYINAVVGRCAANPDYEPEQYCFSLNQNVYVKFEGMPAPPNKYDYKIFVYQPSGAEYAAFSSNVGVSNHVFTLSGGPPIGLWRAAIATVKSPGGGDATFYGDQYFLVQQPGQLSAVLSIAPSPVKLEDEIIVTMLLSNNLANSSDIYPATATLPLRAAGYSGNATITVSLPDPESVTIKYGSPATFTWVFKTTEATDKNGFFALTAEATGVDINSTNAPAVTVVTSNAAVSNGIMILDRKLSLAPNPLDLGTMVCGDEIDFDLSIVNEGNTHFNRLIWQKAYPTSATGKKITYDYFDFFPTAVFSIATDTLSEPGFIRFRMPLNQAAGPYTSEMAIFDDLSGNSAYDLNEPVSYFNLTVTASECRVVMVSPQQVELGGWPVGQETASAALLIVNGGNLNLDKLKFTLTDKTYINSEVVVLPGEFSTPLATDAIFLASISAVIGADSEGEHFAEFTLWDDRNDNSLIDGGEASATFKVRFLVGLKDFAIIDNPKNLGNATPTFTLANFTVLIDNNGDIDLVRPRAHTRNLECDENTIPAEFITIETPSGSVPAGESRIATISVYIPAGTPPGIYQSTQFIYDDENNNGIPDGTANEAERGFLLQLNVNSYFAIQAIPATVDLGGITPGEPPKAVEFLCRNTGNVELSSVSWLPTVLNDLTMTSQITTDRYGITPLSPFTSEAGATFNATITISLLTGQEPGYYIGDSGVIFNNDPAANTSDAFLITCQVGSKAVDILESGPLIATGTPNSISTIANYRVKNIGSLVLAKPRNTTIGNLTDGGNFVSGVLSIFNPATFDFLAANQTKTGAWSVQIPAGQEIGTYSGTIKVWDDVNNSFTPDATEASDTIDVRLHVIGSIVLTVSPSPADLFYVPAGQSATLELLLKNAGNIPIDQADQHVKVQTFPLNPLSPGPPAIDVSRIKFLPAPLAETLDKNETTAITVEVSVPDNQTSGPYEGYQVIYHDRNNNDSYDAGSEESFYLLLKINVNAKTFSVTSPVSMGNGNPTVPGQTFPLTRGFEVKNLSSIPLSKMKWKRAPIEDGSGNQIPESAFAFTPVGPFSVSSMGTKVLTASLTVPMHMSPGFYSGLQTLYEDENGNGILDNLEASQTFLLTVNVNSYEKLLISPPLLDLGDLIPGQPSGPFTFTVFNVGNVEIADLDDAWVKSDLTGPATILADLIKFTSITNPLPAGDDETVTVNLEPISTSQPAGVYQGSQTLSGEFLELVINVLSSVPGPDFAPGSVYQQFPPTVFSDVAPERLIASIWVCPATGSARIAFIESLSAGTIVSTTGLTIDKDGVIAVTGAVIDAGITETQYQDHGIYGKLAWYRVYFAFDYQYNPAVADDLFIVLQNANTDPLEKTAVWFDGFQLEKAISVGQTRPSGFSRKAKLISPTRKPDVSGNTDYNEW